VSDPGTFDPIFHLGDLVDDIGGIAPSGARLRFGVVDAVLPASGSDRACVLVDGLPIPYDAAYSPVVNDVIYWHEDGQTRVVGGKLA